MKRNKIVPILIIAVVVIVAAVASVYFVANPSVWRQALVEMELTEPEAGGLVASGFIEADEVAIAPELGGRVVRLLADEGKEIEAGQLLVRLDDTLLEAQIAVAQAAVGVSEAQLAQAKAGVRPERIRKAEAELAQAVAARDGAYQAWQDTLAIRENPQELNAQIAQAEARVAAAEAALAQAIAMKDAAEIAQENYWEAKDAMEEAKEKLRDIPEPFRPSLPGMQLDFHLIPNAYWKAWVGVNTAEAGLDGARAALNDLYAMRDNPQELNAQVDEAETRYRTAESAVSQVQAQVDALRAGATEEEIAVVEAQVEQARAALNTLLVQRDKFTITAPVGGLVLERSIHEGELAAPGATILTLGDLDKVDLTVYVPLDKLGQVGIGQRVEVRVDSFPEKTFTGSVVDIAQEAEFTPRNVQTQEERVNMVYAVYVEIPNPDHDLKPGLPADAVIVTEE